MKVSLNNVCVGNGSNSVFVGHPSHVRVDQAGSERSTYTKAHDSEIRPYYVNPYEVEYRPNPVLFAHLTNMSHDPDAIALARASSPILRPEPGHDGPPPIYELESPSRYLPQEPVSMIDGVLHA
jgi:hypothetical protein